MLRNLLSARILGFFKPPDKLQTSLSASAHEQLFAVLYPGQPYSPECAALLASRLRQVAAELEDVTAAGPQPEGRGRDLDFSMYQQRRVALQVLYLGHSYDGFAKQDSTPDTVEEHLFAAFRRTRLVPAAATWQELHYSRGGRTDKGVSGLGQVVALTLRSKGRAGQPVLEEEEEMDYPVILNRALPDDIRVIGWTTVPEDFSARFSAQFREYKYFILEEGSGLDLEKMREAAGYLLGEHDFSNYCKPDVAAVRHFRRRIYDVQLRRVEGLAWGDRKVVELYIRGTAFLWHQVRCMAAVLLMVGQGHEEPAIVKQLLDVDAVPGKPQYVMASEEPLLLYSCTYDGLSFNRSKKNYAVVLGSVRRALSSHLIRGGLLHAIEEKLLADGDYDIPVARAYIQGRSLRHAPLLSRQMGASIEERRRRLEAALAASPEAEAACKAAQLV